MDQVLLNQTWSVHSVSRFTQTLSTSPGQIEKELSPRLPTTSSSDQCSNYCRVTWISCDGMEPTGPAVSKKRKRSGETSRHLCIQVFLGEDKAGEVVLCFASSSTTETVPPENDSVSSFDYLLARGRKTAYEAVWSWLKKTTGCWISNASCQFTSAEITLATTQWTRQALERQSKKPLSLIFQVPPHLQKSGLETVTVTIPPASLDHFCQCIENARPPGRNLEEPLPVLKALHAFVQEAFHMDVTTFPLIKVSCETASLGLDGRFRPQNADTLPNVLDFFRLIVQERYAMPETGKGDASEDSDHSDG